MNEKSTYPAVLGVAFAATAFEFVALLLSGAATEVPIRERVRRARNFMMTVQERRAKPAARCSVLKKK